MYGFLDKPTHTYFIDGGKWITAINFFAGIAIEERTHIVPAQSKRHLSQVIGPKTKELGFQGDFIRRDRSSWDLNHRANLIVDLYTARAHHLVRYPPDNGDLIRKLRPKSDQRHHDFGPHYQRIVIFAVLCHRFKDRGRLHFSDFRIKNAEPAAAAAKHWILFMECLDTIDDETDAHL